MDWFKGGELGNILRVVVWEEEGEGGGRGGGWRREKMG